MSPKTLIAGVLLLLMPLLWLPAVAQQTPGAMVESYDALAESILATRRLESGFVGALLDDHRRTAEELMNRGEFERTAAEMTLFANEGDGAIGRIRQRLVEVGHQYHAGNDRYESGFVIVTREARREILAAADALEQATTDEQRQEAWSTFALAAETLRMAD